MVKFSGQHLKITRGQLTQIERRLCHFRLPDEYAKFLLSHNGGSPTPNAFTWEHPSLGSQQSSIDRFLGYDFEPIHEHLRQVDIVSTALVLRDDLPQFSVPIATVDGHDILLTFVHGPRKNQIHVKKWDEVSVSVDEPGSPEDGVYFVANSFRALIDGLHPFVEPGGA